MRQTGANGIETRIDYDGWQKGFSVGSTHGMTCDICSCLVRQTPTDAARHIAWHQRVDRAAEDRGVRLTSSAADVLGRAFAAES